MAERKNSDARIRANNKYAAKAYDRINIAVQKGKKDIIQAHAEQQGQSVNAYINAAIDEKMSREPLEGRTTPVAPSGVNLYSEKDNAASAASEGLTEGSADNGTGRSAE